MIAPSPVGGAASAISATKNMWGAEEQEAAITIPWAKIARNAATVGIFLSVGICQTQTKSRPKPEKLLPLSAYMRKAGLLYLDQLDDFKHECDTDADACERILDSDGDMERVMGRLEDRIAVDIDESGRPQGDAPYLDLLKLARGAAVPYLNAIKDVEYWRGRDRARAQAILEGHDPGSVTSEVKKGYRKTGQGIGPLPLLLRNRQGVGAGWYDRPSLTKECKQRYLGR